MKFQTNTLTYSILYTSSYSNVRGGLYTCMECKGKFPLIWPVHPRPYSHTTFVCTIPIS